MPSALIAPEAARRLDGGDLVEIEIENGLQSFAGGAIAGGFGKRLEPVAVLGLFAPLIALLVRALGGRSVLAAAFAPAERAATTPDP